MSQSSNAPVAALDCGTNSTRLLIVSADGVALSRQMHITRLGEGVDATRQLQPEAIVRTLAVLTQYRQEMDVFGVNRARLVATSAVRDARNGHEFLRQASEIIGIDAKLLTGSEEGRFSFEGATSDLESVSGDDVVIDIGGGSTEIVLHQAGSLSTISLDMGCVRITERFLHGDPPLPREISLARDFVRASCADAIRAIPGLALLRPSSRLLGLAGTVATLAMLQLGLEQYDRELVHHSCLSKESVEHWERVLAREARTERLRRRAISTGREDVILGGVVVLSEAMSALNFNSCIVCESDILDGLALSQIAEIA